MSPLTQVLVCYRQLRHDPSRRKFKTAIKWRNLNPEFHEEFAFEVKLGELSRRSLILTVWDKDLGKANDYLGKGPFDYWFLLIL